MSSAPKTASTVERRHLRRPPARPPAGLTRRRRWLAAPAPARVGVGQASGEGASSVDCSFIDPALGGRLVFTANGQLLANCWEHAVGGAEPTGGSAELTDCSEALQMPGAEGVAVTTPQGNVYINCHVHF